MWRLTRKGTLASVMEAKAWQCLGARTRLFTQHSIGDVPGRRWEGSYLASSSTIWKLGAGGRSGPPYDFNRLKFQKLSTSSVGQYTAVPLKDF